MKAIRLIASVLLAFAGAQAGAQGTSGMTMPAKPASGASAAAMPLVQGEVRKVAPDKGLIVLRLGDIPNLAMPPMTMGFDVADKKMLENIKVGDKVQFQAEMVKGKATVTELKK